MMPEPTVDQVAPGGVIDLSNAPASLDDATFDSLFPADGVSVTVKPAQQATEDKGNQQQQQSQQAQPVQTQTSEPVIKGKRSVYKTIEAAVEGVNQKDDLIDTLRQRYALTTGIDPITGQPVGQATQVVDDYTQNPNKYLDDLYAAAKQGGPQAYTAVQQKLIMDTLKPFAPILGSLAKNQAIDSVAKENPEAAKFVTTPAFQKTMDANPDLASAIATAESDNRFYSRLPGLYKLAYLAGQGMQLPDLLKANTASQNQNQNQPQPVRTTAQPTTLNPSTEAAKGPSFKTLDGIRATIKDLEARGARLDF
jgi:hypothetical protein